MKGKIEKNFVKKFIVKDKRDRLLFELCSKKRVNGIGRFCHNAGEILLQEKIIVSGNHLHYDEIIKIIEQYGVSERWHIIAFNKSIDGVTCKLSEALNLVLGNGMAAIIVSDTMAIVESEQCSGTPTRYILHD